MSIKMGFIYYIYKKSHPYWPTIKFHYKIIWCNDSWEESSDPEAFPHEGMV